jgi:hypothetical protein
MFRRDSATLRGPRTSVGQTTFVPQENPYLQTCIRGFSMRHEHRNSFVLIESREGFRYPDHVSVFSFLVLFHPTNQPETRDHFTLETRLR